MESPDLIMPLSVALINKLRSFDHKSHTYDATYLEQLHLILSNFNQSNGTTSNMGKNVEERHILTVHFYLSLIYNLQDFISLKDEKLKVDELNISGFNNTNIFNVHSLFRAVKATKVPKQEDNSQALDLQLLNKFSFVISPKAKNECKSDEFAISWELIDLTLNARGKLDLGFTSVLCHGINNVHKTKLYSYLFYTNLKEGFVPDFNDSACKILEKSLTTEYSKSDFEAHKSVFVQEKDKKILYNILADLEDVIYYAIFKQDKVSIKNLEQLLVALLGHRLPEIREKAVAYLNVINDGIDWELRGPYNPRITTVGSEFRLDYLIESDKDDSNIGFMISSYPLDGTDQEPVISCHIPRIDRFLDENKNSTSFIIVSIDLGYFPRAGFYDWKLMKFQRGGKIGSVYTANINSANLKKSVSDLSDLSPSTDTKEIDMVRTKVIHGRFIVHPKSTKDLSLHELYAHCPNGTPGDFNVGSFKKISESLPEYSKAGVNCIYLNGVLENDYKHDDDLKKKKQKKRATNPLAITCRKTVSSFLGGDSDFKNLVTSAKQKKLQLLVDCTSRVSSSHANKRYKPYFLNHIDEDGKILTTFGAEGFSNNFEDTTYLNLRRNDAWDLLISETVEFIREYGVDGIHIDDAQTWPQIFDPDYEELDRRDTDGTPAYTINEKFYGAIIKPRSVSGYWATEYSNLINHNFNSGKQKWANPLLVRLCKNLWRSFPNCLIIGEAWSGQGYENRDIALVKSGIIPRLFKIPLAVAAIYGLNLHRDGTITTCEKQNINSLRSWYESSRRNWPSGTIAIQSSTSHAWPYPSFLYKKGAWSYIDLLFFLPDLAMTFMGELDGHSYRSKTYKHYQTQLERLEKRNPKMSRENLLTAVFEADENYFETGKLSVGQNVSEKNRTDEYYVSSEQMWKEIGPEFGFDLKKIHFHYEHRRQLRAKYPALSRGRLVPLLAEHGTGFHSHVLSFARVLEKDLVIVATNFNEFNVFFSINMKNLKYIFDELDTESMESTVIKITDYIGNEFDEYYTVYEFLYGKIDRSLKPHASLVWGATVITNDKSLYEKTMKDSMDRIKKRISQKEVIEGNEVAAMLTNVVKDVNSLQEFANNLGYLTSKFLKPNKLSLPQMFNSIKEFRDDPSLSAKLFAFCHLLYKRKLGIEDPKDENLLNEIKFSKKRAISIDVPKASLLVKATQSDITANKTIESELEAKNEMRTIFDHVREILEYNRLGPIAFITPELGKWSTVGGIGVMVDELSQGLVELGEEVIVVSPYYERNRKGETDYFDKKEITYIGNLDVYLGDGLYSCGIHHGVVKGVELYFIHNPFVFTRPYPDGDARFTMKQLSLIAKCSLEIFCHFKIIPSLIISNDWYTGLIGAYPKNGQFGDVFKGTKFLHIVHNLDPSYEGRMYPNPDEGHLEFIHGLPYHLFVDPYWKERVINPSRCALLSSDQWATVSPSYRQELLESSPLAGILKNHPHPFAFPNGIPKEIRLKKLKDTCGNDHLKAKEALQKKYFGLEKLDDSCVLMGFVGRITQQKGVHLILESAEQLIKKHNGKVMILVGGMVNLKEPYGSYCAGMMYDLANRYRNNFWANPTEFFTDGTLVNCGADFGLMPSMFEPGGIVQHEFFVASTPVIAFETGGLKDSVFEFDPQTEKGCGFTFKDYKIGDFLYAVERAIALFKKKEKYLVLRKNAFEGCVDGADVSRAWNKEFHRLYNKTFIDPVLMKTHLSYIEDKFDESVYEEKFTLKKVVPEIPHELQRLKTIHHRNHYLKLKDSFKSSVFYYKTNKLPRPKSVSLVGTFSNWNPIPMNYDHILGKWNVTIQLHSGEYWYKFIVDDVWVWTDDDPKINDLQGNINNYIRVL